MAGESQVTRVTTISGGGVTVGGVTETVNVDLVTSFKKVIPANTTNGRIQLAIALDTAKVIAISANKACTVKTNSSSTPVDTLTLQANKSLNYVKDVDPEANLFLSDDVTDLYVTSGADAIELRVVVGIDSTPGLSG